MVLHTASAKHRSHPTIYTGRAIDHESSETIDTIAAGIVSYRASNWRAFYDGTSSVSITQRPLPLRTI